MEGFTARKIFNAKTSCVDQQMLQVHEEHMQVIDDKHTKKVALAASNYKESRDDTAS